MRVVGGLLIIAIVIAAAVFFADNPGRVAILWQGWQIETSLAVLAAVVLLGGLAAALLWWILSRILGAPRTLRRALRERRRRAGYRALSRGMVAVAAGEPHEAQRCARRADALLEDPPLTLLLSAQAAQLEGDETAARRYFTAMLDRPETEFLGLRGLLNQALAEGDRGTALALAERARRLRPNAGWVALSLFDLEAREGRWEEARDTLIQAERRGLLTTDRARHHRGVILYELSRAALAAGDRRRAASLAAEAQDLAPDLAVLAAHHARLLVEAGRQSRAAQAVERGWRTAAGPELVQVYRTIQADAAPLDRFRAFERLAAQNPEARESQLALAEAALDARLWGEARRCLEAISAEPTPRLCLLMARLEEAENQDLAGARLWLDRAAAARPDPRYVCRGCGGESREWHSRCRHCGEFDTFAWRIPAWAASEIDPPALPPVAATSSELPALAVSDPP